MVSARLIRLTIDHGLGTMDRSDQIEPWNSLSNLIGALEESGPAEKSDQCEAVRDEKPEESSWGNVIRVKEAAVFVTDAVGLDSPA